MKNRLFRTTIITCLITSMLLSALGCGKGKKDAVQETPEITEEEVLEPADEPIEETSEPAEPAYYPWTDPAVKENLPDSINEVSLKDDFYLYTNYDWIKNTEIPEGRSSNSPSYELTQEIIGKTKDVLTDTSLKSHEAKLVQAYYNGFLNWDERNELGAEPIRELVDEIMGISSISEMNSFICKYALGAAPLFIKMENGIDMNDSTKYVSVVYVSDFIMEDAAEYESFSPYGERLYASYIEQLDVLLKKLSLNDIDAEKLLDSAISFEKKWAPASYTAADYMDPAIYEKVNNILSLDELYGLFTQYPIKDFVKAAGYNKTKAIRVENPDEIKLFDSIYVEENLEEMKSYILTRTLLGSMMWLDKECYTASMEAKNKVYGTDGIMPDEDMAYNVISSSLGSPLSQAHLEKYDYKKIKEDIAVMCEDMISTYKEMLNSEEWMSEDTRSRAIKKLDTMRINSVYPDKWKDYSSLSFDGLSFYEMKTAIAKHENNYNASLTNKSVDKEIWASNILDANAYYNPQNNSINIILGFLGGEFYNENMSKEEIYAGIGSIIGHEISHAFDTKGSQFDDAGNFVNWWEDEDYAKFQERADKLISYYDNMVYYDVNVPGMNIQTEAIADMAGISVILKMAESDPDFDHEKFFHQYATRLRELTTLESQMYYLEHDEHPLNYLRANSVLQQYDEFLELYDIKPGDGMYLAPEDRVLVW